MSTEWKNKELIKSSIIPDAIWNFVDSALNFCGI